MHALRCAFIDKETSHMSSLRKPVENHAVSCLETETNFCAALSVECVCVYHVCVRVFMLWVHVFVCSSAHVRVCLYVCACTCVPVCVCMCVYACTCACVCTSVRERTLLVAGFCC